MLFCSKCGYKMDDNDKFCFNCGTPYEKPSIPIVQDMQEETFETPVVQVNGMPSFNMGPNFSSVTKPDIAALSDTKDVDIPEDITEDLSTEESIEIYAVLKYNEGGVIKEFTMTDCILNIGRDPDNCELLLLVDKFIGRNHALIYFKNRQFYIVDLNSKNGTYVNGTKVSGMFKLDYECKIRIANTDVEFKAVV